MFGRRAHRRKRKVDQRSRRLQIEPLEDRQMLAMADIVFLADESVSGFGDVKNWISSIAADLDATLRSNNVDVRYGLIGYSENPVPRLPHS